MGKFASKLLASESNKVGARGHCNVGEGEYENVLFWQRI